MATEKLPGEYLVILERMNWLCFIPENDFHENFIVLPSEDQDEAPDAVKIDEEKFKGPYSNSDTYLQSYCMWHARSCIRPGKWNVRLLGVYYLEED